MLKLIRIGIGAVLAVTVLFASACSAVQQSDPAISQKAESAFDITNLNEIADTVREALKGRSSLISISFSFHGDYMDDISPFVKELMELAQEETGKSDEGDYLRYQLGGYTFSYSNDPYPGGYNYVIQITPQYYTTGKQEELVNEKVQEILNELQPSVDMTDAEKIRAVHDYLVNNVSYDIVHRKNEYHTLKSTAYGALVNHSATCQGYAVAMYRLLSELGIECRVITGEGVNEGSSEYHAWNIAGIDGEYYNIDVTWDDAKDCEDYFLRSEASFTDHERSEAFRTDEFNARYPMAKEDYQS